MIQIVPEIYVKKCKKALDFYRETFGGEIKNLQMSDDLEMFQDHKDKVVHAELHVNSQCVFYFVDIFDELRSKLGNMTLVLHMESQQELEHVYGKLCANGHVDMELQKTFWGEFHAIVTDQFGAPWALNYRPE